MTAKVGLATQLKLCRVLVLSDRPSTGDHLVAVRYRARMPLEAVMVVESGVELPPDRGFRLAGRRCRTLSAVRMALAERGLDFVVIPAERNCLEAALAAAPPNDPASIPWFVEGPLIGHTWTDLAARGCRRAALPSFADADDVDETLRQVWNADPSMERVTFAAFD